MKHAFTAALFLACGARDLQIEGPDWLRDSTVANRFNGEAKRRISERY